MRSRTGLPALAVAMGVCLTACSTDAAEYQDDYARHEPLHVVGYPSTGSLDVVQRVVWRLADGDAEALAALAVEDGSPDATARNWVRAFGAAAQGEVTADFYDEGSLRQVVVLYFAKNGRSKEIEARIGADGSWGITMDEPDPDEAAATPGWAPDEPGGTGSRSGASHSPAAPQR
ncbi:hypothetical protein OHS70_27185 [Streptomyces sp. NBC_00390]|uniref:hypothetical protein n=1 Tax=Streptomyces sp. NBC_00390 TaxID=2975736 RepID=UPI002E251032